MQVLLASRRWLFPLVLIFCAAWIALTAMVVPANAVGRPPVARQGFPAPEFSLPTFEGTTLSLSDFAGQVVVVNFWASWCPPCRAEMPAMQAVYEELVKNGVVILAVNAADQDDPQAARRFVQELKLTFPILEDTTGSASRAYQVNALPSTYFIDKSGVIQKVVYGGPLTEALLRAEIAQLMME